MFAPWQPHGPGRLYCKAKYKLIGEFRGRRCIPFWGSYSHSNTAFSGGECAKITEEREGKRDSGAIFSYENISGESANCIWRRGNHWERKAPECCLSGAGGWLCGTSSVIISIKLMSICDDWRWVTVEDPQQHDDASGAMVMKNRRISVLKAPREAEYNTQA